MSDDNNDDLTPEQSRKRRAELAKKRGLKPNVDDKAVAEKPKTEEKKVVGNSRKKTEDKDPKWFERQTDFSKSSSGGLVSGHPVLDKIGRFLGLHLLQQVRIGGADLGAMVINLALFMAVAFVIGNITGVVLNLITLQLFGTALFTGIIMGFVVQGFFITIPLTTRALYYGIKLYRKINK